MSFCRCPSRGSMSDSHRPRAEPWGEPLEQEAEKNLLIQQAINSILRISPEPDRSVHRAPASSRGVAEPRGRLPHRTQVCVQLFGGSGVRRDKEIKMGKRLGNVCPKITVTVTHPVAGGGSVSAAGGTSWLSRRTNP